MFLDVVDSDKEGDLWSDDDDDDFAEPETQHYQQQADLSTRPIPISMSLKRIYKNTSTQYIIRFFQFL